MSLSPDKNMALFFLFTKCGTILFYQNCNSKSHRFHYNYNYSISICRILYYPTFQIWGPVQKCAPNVTSTHTFGAVVALSSGFLLFRFLSPLTCNYHNSTARIIVPLPLAVFVVLWRYWYWWCFCGIGDRASSCLISRYFKCK
jgi:hypothetical protein